MAQICVYYNWPSYCLVYVVQSFEVLTSNLRNIFSLMHKFKTIFRAGVFYDDLRNKKLISGTIQPGSVAWLWAGAGLNHRSRTLLHRPRSRSLLSVLTKENKQETCSNPLLCRAPTCGSGGPRVTFPPSSIPQDKPDETGLNCWCL